MQQSSHLFLSVTEKKLRWSLIILKSWIFSDRIEQLKWINNKMDSLFLMLGTSGVKIIVWLYYSSHYNIVTNYFGQFNFAWFYRGRQIYLLTKRARIFSCLLMTNRGEVEMFLWTRAVRYCQLGSFPLWNTVSFKCAIPILSLFSETCYLPLDRQQLRLTEK
jgi:hypothetical protein